jgi:hypothetical protein
MERTEGDRQSAVAGNAVVIAPGSRQWFRGGFRRPPRDDRNHDRGARDVQQVRPALPVQAPQRIAPVAGVPVERVPSQPQRVSPTSRRNANGGSGKGQHFGER